MSALKKFLSRIGGFFVGIGKYAGRHKIQAGIFVLVVAGIGWWSYSAYAKTHTPTQYVLAPVTQGPIQVVVTGTGQVASNHQLNLSPQASGTLTEVNVKAGQTVTAGTIVAEVDPTTAEQTVRDDQADVESAQISLTSAKTSSDFSIANGQSDVDKARDSGFDTVASTFTDLASVTQGLNTVLNGASDVPGMSSSEDALDAYSDLVSPVDPGIDQLKNQAASSYAAAIASYQQTLSLYQAASRTSSPQTIEALLQSTNDTVSSVNQSVKDASAFVDAVNQDIIVHNDLKTPGTLATNISNLSSYTDKVSGDATSVGSAYTTLTTAEQTLSQDTQSLQTEGGTPLDVQTAQLNYQKSEDALQDAETNLDNYIVRAPFDGTIAQVNVQQYDQASSGTTVAVLITNEEYAELSLNEVDASKVQVGQKATMTFDAIPNVTVNGTVAEVDRIGTVTQGVVSYALKISFDTQSPSILPGMTVDASIIVASKTDAIQVPSAAIKTQGNFSYVEVATGAPALPTANASSTRAFTGRTGSTTGLGSTTRQFTGSSTRAFGSTTGTGGTAAAATRTQTVDVKQVTVKRVPVTIGLASDTMTEITSGLTPGEKVVTQTLNVSGKSTTTAAPSLLGAIGGGGARAGGAAGGGVRAGGAGAGAARAFGG